MLTSVLKFLVFASIVLLFGQIRVGRSTVGEVFHANVARFYQWSSRKLIESNMISSLGDTMIVKRWFGNPVETRPDFWGLHRTPSEVGTLPEEDISEADRDSILRLLQ